MEGEGGLGAPKHVAPCGLQSEARGEAQRVLKGRS